MYLLPTEKTVAWPVIASLILLKGTAQRTGRTDGAEGLTRITPTAAVKAVRSPVANTSLDPDPGLYHQGGDSDRVLVRGGN